MNRPTSHKVFILIASQFDETAVVTCLDQMRAQGIGVSLVGLLAGLLPGAFGLVVRPDLTLAELMPMVWPADDKVLIVIPGGWESAALLLSDPRVHEVCTAVGQAGGYVAVFAPAQQLFRQTHCVAELDEGYVMVQDGVETAVFVQQVAAVALGENLMGR